MLVLGIETSCDETSAAVVEDGRHVRSCIIASSKKDFEALGGVIPEDAARRQLESILPVIDKALAKAKLTIQDIDAIAVTHGPGLLGSLLVGTSTARVIASVFQKPLIPVHHTLGHLSSSWLRESEKCKVKSEKCTAEESRPANHDEPQFPILTLSVSGGHTDLWYRTSHTKGKLVSSTMDDAAGEAFDKGAVMLGLGYPGGPALSHLAETGDESAYGFPSPLKGKDTLDFSFSGLKTSLKYLLRDLRADNKDIESIKASIAASFEKCICEHLCDRLRLAAEQFPDTQEIHIVGGVSANRKLRLLASELGKKLALTVRFPVSLRYCTDNGAMIASAAYFSELEKLSPKTFQTKATMDLASVVGEV